MMAAIILMAGQTLMTMTQGIHRTITTLSQSLTVREGQ